jgi:hypothetical protein
MTREKRRAVCEATCERMPGFCAAALSPPNRSISTAIGVVKFSDSRS